MESRLCHSGNASKYLGGYSLVEVMVAIMIGAMGIVSLATAAIKSHRVLVATQQQTDLVAANTAILSTLRIHLGTDPTAPFSLTTRTGNTSEFNTTASQSTTDSTIAIQHDMQLLVNTLAGAHASIRSEIECSGIGPRSCEVCFHWYDHSATLLPAEGLSPPDSVALRMHCDTQLA